MNRVRRHRQVLVDFFFRLLAGTCLGDGLVDFIDDLADAGHFFQGTGCRQLRATEQGRGRHRPGRRTLFGAILAPVGLLLEVEVAHQPAEAHDVLQVLHLPVAAIDLFFQLAAGQLRNAEIGVDGKLLAEILGQFYQRFEVAAGTQ